MQRLSLGRIDRRAALIGVKPLFKGDPFRVRRRCAHATDKGGNTVLLSVALECLQDLGKVSMECSVVAADDNVCVNGNQRVSLNRHHVLQ